MLFLCMSLVWDRWWNCWS